MTLQYHGGTIRFRTTRKVTSRCKRLGLIYSIIINFKALCAGLEYLEAMGCIVGCVNGPIIERNIESVNEKELPKLLATKIMMLHLVSTDGKASIPLGHFPTNGVTAQWLLVEMSLYI